MNATIMAFSKSRYFKVYYWREKIDETSRNPISYCEMIFRYKDSFSDTWQTEFKEILIRTVEKRADSSRIFDTFQKNLI